MNHTLGAFIDFLILAGYFVFIVSFGLKQSRKSTDRAHDNLGDYSLGGRSIPFWAVLLSIIAAETSAATFLGVPAEGYTTRSYAFVSTAVGVLLGRWLSGVFFIKKYYHYKVYSLYEYMDVRFGPKTRRTTTVIFLVTRLLASGTRLYVCAIVLAVFLNLLRTQMGLPVLTSVQEWVLYAVAIVVMSALTAVYTAVGGIRAVIWTDVIQAGLMIGSATIALIVLFLKSGAHPFEGVNFRVLPLGFDSGDTFLQAITKILGSPYTIWSGLFAVTATTLATHGTDQDMVQRALTAKNSNEGRKSLMGSGLVDIPIMLLFLTIGVLLHSFYSSQPTTALPERTNEIFPFFIFQEMPVGLRGLMLAGVFSTGMGSLSAALNALATSFAREVDQKHTGHGAVQIAKRATYGFSFLMALVALGTAAFVVYQPKSGIIPIVIGIFGYTYGAMLGVFLLASLTKTRGNDRTNTFAMVMGFIAVAIMSRLPNDILVIFGSEPFEYPVWLPQIAFSWRIVVGAVTSFGIGALFKTNKSRSTGEK